VSPERLRAYVLIVTRDIAPPLAGLFLTIWLPLAGQLEAWQLPLIAGLFGVPLVAPRESKDPPS
jgi:hypothetical protein